MNPFNQNLTIFFQHCQPFCDVMQKKIEKLEFAQGVNFESIDSLENNGTKYLLTFDNSRREICNSRTFVAIDTADEEKTSWIEHFLQEAQRFSSNQNGAKRWAPVQAQCSLQISPWFDASQCA